METFPHASQGFDYLEYAGGASISMFLVIIVLDDIST